MKKMAFVVLLVFLIMNAANGLQQKPIYNRPGPGDDLTKKQIEALYKKALKEDALPLGAIELELKYRFPLDNEVDEKEIYFRNFHYFSVDDRGHVYAPDNALSVVYEFDQNGKLLEKYAKAGQGPGELDYPDRVFFHDQNVALYESMGKFLYFNRAWTYLNSSTNRVCIPFGIAPNGDVFGSDVTREKLVAVSDSNGRLLRRFGEPPFPRKPRSPLNRTIIGLSPSGSVWVCFPSLGIIRKYSLAGELLKEIDFQEHLSDFAASKIKMNFKDDRNGEPRSHPVFDSIAFLHEDILITGGGRTYPIYRLADDGRLKAVYFIPPEYGIERRCQFAAVDENQVELFYVKTRFGDFPGIGVYRPKRQDAAK